MPGRVGQLQSGETALNRADWFSRFTAACIARAVCSPSGRNVPLRGMIVPHLIVLAVNPCDGSEFVAQRTAPPAEIPGGAMPRFSLRTPPFDRTGAVEVGPGATAGPPPIPRATTVVPALHATKVRSPAESRATSFRDLTSRTPSARRATAEARRRR